MLLLHYDAVGSEIIWNPDNTQISKAAQKNNGAIRQLLDPPNPVL
jgi:hypothetical protein